LTKFIYTDFEEQC